MAFMHTLLKLLLVLAVAAQLTCIQRLSVLATDASECSTNELAQNSSVVLSWTLRSGDESFTRISHTSEVLVSTAAASDAGRLLIIGGIEYESAQPVVVNPLLVYDLKTNVFFKPKDAILSSLSAQQTTSTSSTAKRIVDDTFTSPASRADHASFVAKSVVYVFGGQNKEFLNDTWRLCVDASSTTASWDQLVALSDAVALKATPVPRVGHSFTQVFENASVIGAIVYGGISEAYLELDGLHMAFIAKSSPAGGTCTDRSPKVTWRMLPAVAVSPTTGVPAARAYHSAMVVSKLFSSTQIVCLLVHGGKNTQQGLIFDELWRLCPSTASSNASFLIVEKQIHVWELLTPLGTTPGARYGAGVTFVDEGKLALSGGSYTFPNDFLRDTWELNVNATQWIRLSFDSDYTPPRRSHSLTFFQASSTLFLFGGKDRYTVVQKRIESTLYAAPYCATGYRITLCEATGKYVCIPCPAGLFLQSGTRNCLSCAQGTFSALGAAECTKCPAGTYSTLVGKTSDAPCTQCPVGTASNALGASSLTVCLGCAAGSFASTPGSTTCSMCLPGSYSNASARTCTLCKPGQWSAAGAPTCLGCAAGSYNPNNGSSSCFACPKGFYSNASAEICAPCPLNTFSNSTSASISGCQACPSFSFTVSTGQTRCVTCASGSSFVNSTCVKCSEGSFSSADTSGACQQCPPGSYSTVSGSTQCVKCPDGSTISSAGAKNATACAFCQAGFYLDTTDSQCRSCPPGTFPSSTGFCSRCAPGRYTSSVVEAAQTDTGDCLKCSAMTYASDFGTTGCNACADGAFSLTGWKNCVTCGLTEQQLVGCKAGRNGLMCSGNGQCIYGGCACNDGWTSADCSTPTSDATAPSSSAPSVLYFPSSQSPLIIEFPVTKSNATASILVARSGKSNTPLSAQIRWSSSNFSAALSGFPMTVSLAVGERNKTILVALSTLTPRTGCRFFTLALQDLADVITSAVSTESDKSLTIYVDDMNGVGGGVSGRAIASVYVADPGAGPTANVSLDRVVSTQVTLSPTMTTGSTANLLLQNQRMTILVAIDRTSAPSIVSLLPALIAKLQMQYQLNSDSIQMGLLLGSTNSSASGTVLPSTRLYPELKDFFAAAEGLRNSSARQQQELLSWEWMTAALSSNTSTWTATGRRFLWVFDFNQLSLAFASPSSAATAFQSTMRLQSIFSFFVQPSAGSPLSRGGNNTVDFTGVADIMQQVVCDSTVLLPSRVLNAHTAKDTSLPSIINVLEDQYSLIVSAQVQSFASGTGSLPVLKIVLNAIPTTFAAGIMLGIPGLLRLKVQVQEPSHACFPQVVAPPADPQLFSGWMDLWTLSSPLADLKRRWNSSSSSVEMQLYEDTSLLRTVTSTRLTLKNSQSTRLTLTQTLAGLDFSAGLSLVARGYMRSTNTNQGQWARCQQKILMYNENATVVVEAAITYDSTMSQGDWRYGWLQRVVSVDLTRVDVILDCNTSTPGVVVEWTTLGLLPEPSFACKCPRGFFNDVINAGNTTTTVTGGDTGECIRCPAGSYCAAGIKRRCPDGSFSFGKSSSCETCRDGWICVDGLARLCNPGTYASPSFTCEVCPAGYACRNGKKSSCPVGTFSLRQASDCQSCPPGTISRLEAYVLR